MSDSHSRSFGDKDRWAEPAWYNALDSPYYNDSHRALREYVRSYIDTRVLPFADKWGEKGEVPREETTKFAMAGLAFPEIPKEHRPGIQLPVGVGITNGIYPSYDIARRNGKGACRRHGRSCAQFHNRCTADRRIWNGGAEGALASLNLHWRIEPLLGATEKTGKRDFRT
ncbi:uncharacterized protein A1O5_12459 [Cladophialophora psammophila CBS 110553]|uniref:Acyl-CoA dehydrogenase/oxidase N-terminal domain-containing protein n=1 Tax=Cladophialophora psammophila CBS 110553 TaxID=1182543 RepID=W9WGM7_9EURO|nr:uncharacterized protein A1O5_12459 [Cladophialophora psammophila CBS 110553]EXJ57669.1 hypothetical protein A1O5_12459 [Cladophialophora psammophila CBS 110553]